MADGGRRKRRRDALKALRDVMVSLTQKYSAVLLYAGKAPAKWDGWIVDVASMHFTYTFRVMDELVLHVQFVNEVNVREKCEVLLVHST